MAVLTLPTAEQLDSFSDNATDDFSTGSKEQAIQQAADLLYLATEVTEQPTDVRTARIVANGLMDMAWALLIRTSSKTEINSPFNSERIGSYSYQKAGARITKGLMSGVEWFDTAVAMLLSADVGSVWLETENVFGRPYVDETAVTVWTSPDFFGR